MSSQKVLDRMQETVIFLSDLYDSLYRLEKTPTVVEVLRDIHEAQTALERAQNGIKTFVKETSNEN
jgi:hypothetical protein